MSVATRPTKKKEGLVFSGVALDSRNMRLGDIDPNTETIPIKEFPDAVKVVAITGSSAQTNQRRLPQALFERLVINVRYHTDIAVAFGDPRKLVVCATPDTGTYCMVAASEHEVSTQLSRLGRSAGAGWAGHLPATQRRMLAIMERAAVGANGFTPAERSLFVLCEFWAAVNGRDLGTLLRVREEKMLLALIAICGALQLSEVSRILTVAQRDLKEPLAQVKRRHRLAALEAALLGLNAPIDRIIGDFARSLSPVSRFRAATWEQSSALSEAADCR